MTIVILLLSCKKNHHKVVNSKNLWLNSCKLPFVVVTSDETIDKEYIINNQNLVVQCPDNYDQLSTKVYLSLKAIDKIFQPSGILKIDDDMLIDNQKLQEFVNSLTEDIHYAGSFAKDLDFWTNFHYGKCESDHLNKTLQYVPANDYCRGPAYYLSKKSIKIIVQSMDPKLHLYEDVAVGLTLYKNGIKATHVKFVSDFLEYFINDGYIGLHDNNNNDFESIKKQYQINKQTEFTMWWIIIIIIVICFIFAV
jgi:hypothetical protein